ncbi:hypothetical protein FHT44_005096 [Mycolicibacterium sp. BK634]|nr:hypothetical protein [Mycolicibacterium sp. BK634]
MNRLGLRAPSDVPAEPLWSEMNHETGMVATAYQDPDSGLIVETYHDSVGLVTWYRADDEAQVLTWLGLK